jgi:predicted RNA-binding Zn-ribbon protein involved in translation (DUF1610 family)
MAKICKKCGYERHISDKSPEYECPKCGAIYAKVDAFLEKEKVEPKKSNFCNQCGIDISKQTNSSHKCNKEEKDKAKASGTVLITAIVLVFLFIWPNYQSILDKIIPSRNIATESVTPEELYGSYEKNEINADLKYKNKVIKTTGKIRDIAKDIINDPYIHIDVKGNLIFGIQCFLSKNSLQKATGLNRGQNVTISGRVEGKFGNVIIRNCRIE